MTDFTGTKWDVREWTEEQKTKWQKKCFELGYRWCVGEPHVDFLDKLFYYVGTKGALSYGRQEDIYLGATEEVKVFEDMFPQTEETIPDPKTLPTISTMPETVMSQSTTITMLAQHTPTYDLAREVVRLREVVVKLTKENNELQVVIKCKN